MGIGASSTAWGTKPFGREKETLKEKQRLLSCSHSSAGKLLSLPFLISGLDLVVLTANLISSASSLRAIPLLHLGRFCKACECKMSLEQEDVEGLQLLPSY